MKTKDLISIAKVLRHDSIRATTAAGSGHPTSCMSAAEIMSVLFFDEMHFDPKSSHHSEMDEFIMSKGHCAPILYSALFRSGCIKDDLETLRKLNSRLEGHPNPRTLDWVKVATGSLGQGLSVGVGMALAAKLQNKSYHTYVLMGDGEIAEGSVYEACQLAEHYKLNNLTGIVDINRLAQSEPAMYEHNIRAYKKRFEGFGWKVIAINGHSISQIKSAFAKSKKSKQPVMILAKTFKGKGVSFLENKEGFHGKALNKEEAKKAYEELGDAKMPKFKAKLPTTKNQNTKSRTYSIKTNYKLGKVIATRKAYGSALSKLADHDKNIIATDGDTKNSTYAIEILKKTPKQFIEGYIAEQNLVGMATGLSTKGYNVFASAFAAFFSRAHDQIRMAGVSGANLNFVGSHAGASIGEDGASQMALEDLAMFRSLPESTCVYPSDAISTEKLLAEMAGLDGIRHMRTTRMATPVIYKNSDTFPIGKFKTLKLSTKDKVVLIGAGVTLHECMKAHHILKDKKISSRVIDLYSIKPFPSKELRQVVERVKNVVVVEDHYPEGGLGEAVQSAISGLRFNIAHLAIRHVPHSGSPEQLVKTCKIGADTIVSEAKKLLK